MSDDDDISKKLEDRLTQHLGSLKGKVKAAHDAEQEAALAATDGIGWNVPDAPKDKTEKLFSDVFGQKPALPFKDFVIPVYEATDWDEEVRPFIPKVDEGFVWNVEILQVMVLAYMGRENTFLWGPKGSGKSTCPEQMCARMGIPFIRIPMREDMEGSELFGANNFIPSKGVNWVDGPVTIAAKFGALLCLDESSNITPGAALTMNPLLEENRRLFLTDKIGSIAERNIKVDPRFACVLTDNTNLQGDLTGKYVGTKVQNEAFIDRMFSRMFVGYMEESAEIEMVTKRVPGVNAKLAKLMVKFADLVRKSYTQGHMQMTISPRMLINWGRKATTWGDIKTAYDVAFGNGLADDDKKIAAEFYSKVFGSSR